MHCMEDFYDDLTAPKKRTREAECYSKCRSEQTNRQVQNGSVRDMTIDILMNDRRMFSTDPMKTI